MKYALLLRMQFEQIKIKPFDQKSKKAKPVKSEEIF